MSVKNTKQSFGWVSIVLHWTMAIALIGMYFLGDYMVDLDYYDEWYKSGPDIHRSMGVIIGFMMIFRLLWNLLNTKPEHLNRLANRKNVAASVVHYLLYLLVFLMVISGYLISTAKGQGVDVFGLFEISAFLPDNKDRGELAGDIHEWLGLGFMVLVVSHALAALFHHFVVKDRTLKRMLGVRNKK